MKPQLKNVYEYVDKNFERYVEEIRNYLRITGISITGEGMEEAAEATVGLFRAIGGEAKVVPLKGGYPVAYGKLESKNPKAKTILFYSHYDVVGIPTPNEWTVPPFAAEIVNAEKIGLPAKLDKVIVARGAHDKKGPNLCFILGLRAVKEVLGDVPVNVIFVFEGEEEIWSLNLKQFVDEYFEELNKADACWACGSYRQSQSGVLVVQPGYNGALVLDLEIKGGTWGGTSNARSLHSPYAPFVDQPMLKLVHAIASMLDADGNALVEGFYDNWVSPTPEERKEIEKSKGRLNEFRIMIDLASVKRFKGGLPPEEHFEDYLTAPHIIPVGISSGYEELLPMKAKARLHVRFGPNMSSEELLQKIRKHLYKLGFREIEVHCTTARNEWSRSPISEDIVQALIRTAEIHGVKYVIWPSSAATDAFYLFNRPPLSKPMVCGALGHGGRSHVVDEYITVEGCGAAIKGAVTFVHEYANI